MVHCQMMKTKMTKMMMILTLITTSVAMKLTIRTRSTTCESSCRSEVTVTTLSRASSAWTRYAYRTQRATTSASLYCKKKNPRLNTNCLFKTVEVVPYLIWKLGEVRCWSWSVSRWLSHKPSGRLPLLPERPIFTFPAAQHHRLLVTTKFYCWVTETHVCEQLAQSGYVKV